MKTQRQALFAYLHRLLFFAGILVAGDALAQNGGCAWQSNNSGSPQTLSQMFGTPPGNFSVAIWTCAPSCSGPCYWSVYQYLSFCQCWNTDPSSVVIGPGQMVLVGSGSMDCLTNNLPLLITCPQDKTAPYGPLMFDSPTVQSLPGTCASTASNATISVVSTTTTISGCIERATRVWSISVGSQSMPCSQTITMTNTTPPVLACPTNKTVNCGTAWTFDAPTVVSSCCSNVAINVVSTVTNGGACAQMITRTWSATDCNGNDISCSQTVSVVAPDLSATILTWSAIGGLDFAYTNGGSALGSATTAELFWASGTNVANILGPTPIYVADIPADFTGQASNHVFGFYLQNPPTNATYILLVLDPNNLIAETTKTNNTLALAPQNLSISAQTLAWNIATNPAGLYFEYSVIGGSLPTPTTAQLFWADGTTLATKLANSAFYTNTIPTASSGVGPVYVPSSYLQTQPCGATYILLVVDPDHAIWGATDTNNVIALLNVQFGVDVSHHQNDAGSINWSAITNAGKQFVFVKASENTSVPDGYVKSNGVFVVSDHTIENITNALGVGMLVGVYHLARPVSRLSYVTTNNMGVKVTNSLAVFDTPLDEAQYFLSRARQFIGANYMPPVLDLEQGTINDYIITNGMAVSNLVSWVNAWVQYVEEETCVRPIIYTSKGSLLGPPAHLISELSGYAIWVANPNADPAQTPTYGGVPLANWEFQQYQDQNTAGQCPGIIGPADLDSFRGDLAGLVTGLLSLTNHLTGPKFFGVRGGVIEAPAIGQFSVDISTCGQQQITQITIQGSDDLLNWSDIETLTVTNGIVSFTDATVANHPARYYRVKP